jgi:Ca2+-binding RTX toxin-like protein
MTECALGKLVAVAAFGLAGCIGRWALAAPPGIEHGAEASSMNLILCPIIPDGGEGIAECNGRKASCVGTEGPDLIIGSDEGDVIVAGAGSDVVIGNAGDDLVCAGAGNDSVMGGLGDDSLYGEEGNDWLFGATHVDVLDGGPGDFDVLWGGPGMERLDGGDGDHDVCLRQKDVGEANTATCETVYPLPGDTRGEEAAAGLVASPLEGRTDYRPAAHIIKCPWMPEGLTEIPECGGRAATCVGTEGHDLIYGSSGKDVIWAGGGDDVVHADSGHDILCGGAGIDALMGASGNDVLYGGEGDDWLFGATGDDVLHGGPGDMDVLWAGPGTDGLDGGEGISDVCLMEGCRRAKKVSGYVDVETCETVYSPRPLRAPKVVNKVAKPLPIEPLKLKK